ncbi:peroxiredoxin [Candidatus Magnetominusculus dajiuhuensis]|uniref:peroxiredoxin n=1 Tax=Candidatus Magnetominusculus dajiuhuensis TaxID=3137712 RepID=UPI003B42BF82
MEGTKAVEFQLTGIDENGLERDFTLSDLLKGGKNRLVLYFYPRDNTPGCTQEACDFRDNLNRLLPYAHVVGVSADSVESHKKFKDRHALNFPLLSDPQHKAMEAYGAWGQKISYGKQTTGVIRSTFIIDSDGTIIKHYKAVKAKGHVEKILEYLTAD